MGTQKQRYGQYDIQAIAEYRLIVMPGQRPWGASARITKWSDGSHSMLVAWSESFDTELLALAFALDRGKQWVRDQSDRGDILVP